MSPIDSPRESCISSPRRTIGVAPSSATPTSKEIRVRVEGFSKTSAMLRPASASAPTPLARGRLSARRRGRAACRARRRPSSSPVRKSRFKQRILRRVEFTAIAWNLFHGRDFPPDPALLHLALAAAADRRAQRDPRPGQPRPHRRVRGAARRRRWDVALLQECPPRFAAPLAARLRRRGAPGADLAQLARRRCAALLARQQPRPDRLRRGRLQPDPGPRPRPARRDRRAARAGDPRGPAGAPGDGLHPHRLRRLRRQPARDQRPAGAGAPRTCCAPRAAATEWAGGAPLLFGGDLNLRPAEDPEVFERAARATSAWRRRPAPTAIDHLLVRGLEVARAADRLAARAPRAAARRARPAPLRPRPGRGTIRSRRATDAAELR